MLSMPEPGGVARVGVARVGVHGGGGAEDANDTAFVQGHKKNSTQPLLLARWFDPHAQLIKVLPCLLLARKKLVQRKCARHAEDPSIGPVSAIGRRYSWGGLTPANLHQLTTFHIGCSHTKMMTAFRVTERHDRLILLSAKHMGVLNMVGCTSRHFSLMPGTTPSPIDMSCAFYFQMTCSLNPLNTLKYS